MWTLGLALLCLCAAPVVGAQSFAFGSVVGSGDADVHTTLQLAPDPVSLCRAKVDDAAWVAVFDHGASRHPSVHGANAGEWLEMGDNCIGWPSIRFLDLDGNFDMSADEPLYMDLDESYNVSVHDVRLSGSPGVVAPGDPNLGFPLAHSFLEPQYAGSGPDAPFSPGTPWYFAYGFDVQEGDVRMGGSYANASTPPAPPTSPSVPPTPPTPPGVPPSPTPTPSTPPTPPTSTSISPAGPDVQSNAGPTGPFNLDGNAALFGGAIGLGLLAPLLGRVSLRAETGFAIASWAIHLMLLALGTSVNALSLGVLVWNGLAFVAYRAGRRRAPRGVQRLAGTVGIVGLIEVHADLQNHTWNRDFWMRATSDEEEGAEERVSFMIEAQLGAYRLFFYRRHRVRLEPSVRAVGGDPPKVAQLGVSAGASGDLAVVLNQQVLADHGVVLVEATAEVAFATRAWRVAFAAKGLNVDGTVGGDQVQHRVGLGLFQWPRPEVPHQVSVSGD